MRFLGLLMILSVVSLACNRKNLNQSQQKSEIWNIVGELRYQSGEDIVITFKLEGEEKVKVYNPMEGIVEVQSNDGWKKVSVLYCDCQPCPGPPNERNFTKGKEDNFSFMWDQMSETCDGSGAIRNQVVDGNYRVRFTQLNLRTNERNKLIVQFQIGN